MDLGNLSKGVPPKSGFANAFAMLWRQLLSASHSRLSPSPLSVTAAIARNHSDLRQPSRRTPASYAGCIVAMLAMMTGACGDASKLDDDEQFFKAINQIYGPERNESAAREWNLRKYKYEQALSRRFRHSESGFEQAVGIFLLPSFSLVSEEMHGYKSASEVVSTIAKLASDADAEPATLWLIKEACERVARDCKEMSMAYAWLKRDPGNVLAYISAAGEAHRKGDAREATRVLALGAAKATRVTEYADLVRATAANAIRMEPGVAEIDARLLAAAVGAMMSPLDAVDLGPVCLGAGQQKLERARREACVSIAKLLDHAAPQLMDVVSANVVLKANTESPEEAKSADARASEAERQIRIRGRILKLGASSLSACHAAAKQFVAARKSVSEREATAELIKSESCINSK
jgi:hypothetical protein